MTAGPGATADPSELELVTRTFDARRELVVRLWIGRNILRTWEVPRGVEPVSSRDSRREGYLSTLERLGASGGALS
jgi:hypothetical protein